MKRPRRPKPAPAGHRHDGHLRPGPLPSEGTPAATERAAALLGQINDHVIELSSPDAAELAKLLENVFRNVNIALVNQLALLCERMGLDVWEVIDAAATKPFGFMRFTPGPGVGGHCIPVDPYYLAWRAREFDFIDRFVELAGDINFAMPRHVVDLVAEALNDRGTGAQGRPGRRPRRGLQAERPRRPQLAGRRRHRRASRRAAPSVGFHDPHVPTFRDADGASATASRSLDDAARRADVVVVVTAHRAIDWDASTRGRRPRRRHRRQLARARRSGRARCCASGPAGRPQARH